MKGGGEFHIFGPLFGVFSESFVFPFFVFEGGEWGGAGQIIMSDLKASLKVTLPKV